MSKEILNTDPRPKCRAHNEGQVSLAGRARLGIRKLDTQVEADVRAVRGMTPLRDGQTGRLSGARDRVTSRRAAPHTLNDTKHSGVSLTHSLSLSHTLSLSLSFTLSLSLFLTLSFSYSLSLFLFLSLSHSLSHSLTHSVTQALCSHAGWYTQDSTTRNSHVCAVSFSQVARQKQGFSLSFLVGRPRYAVSGRLPSAFSFSGYLVALIVYDAFLRVVL